MPAHPPETVSSEKRNIIQPLASERNDFGLWRVSRNGWGKGAEAGRSLRDGPSHQQV